MLKKNNVKAMPSKPRPSGFSGASTSSGRPSSNTPMSERQQMALLMQMTSPNNQSDSSIHGPARSRDRNERGETALHVAAIKGDQDGVKKLLDQGMSVNVTDFAGWTPLHEACNHGHYNVALTLVKAGANINAKALEDNTPLHDAAIIGHMKLVKMLVEKGADPTIKNRKGKTPCDVAAPSVYNYLLQAKDAASNRSSQQVKKSSETKKSNSEENDENSCTNSGGTTVTNTNMTKEDDDIYEFKTTPKETNSGEEKGNDNGKNSEKSEEKPSTDDTNVSNSGGGIVSKRAYNEVESTEDSPSTEDESKRKKRKDGEQQSKDVNKTTSGSRVTPRPEKGKVVGAASKAISLSTKSGVGDRKSPCASPKPSTKTTDSDAEVDSDVKAENFSSSGPKVPPLKIVIPQQNNTGDQETGSRNGKNTSARSHAALPYVVASSNSGNESNTDKESSSSRCASPVETVKAVDDKQTKVAGTTTADERAQQRVLRSSHRSGGSTGQSVDRGSNNSSPQLQSSSPSPAPSGTETSTTNNSQQNSNTDSPVNQTQTASNENETTTNNAPSPAATVSTTPAAPPVQNTVELHPRKRKIRASKDDSKSVSNNTVAPPANDHQEKESIVKEEIHITDTQPITNCYQMFLNIRKQIEKRQKSLFPVQPKPPQGFKDYLLNRCNYVLSGRTPAEPAINFPTNLPTAMKDLFQAQEKERHKLKLMHVVDKEKLVLAVEQEILRVHGRAARALANQSLPFSVCTILKDEEVYNMITPEQEEKDRNARSRYNGRLFLSWLQDVDDKWEKIKESMLFRHHNEVESLHAVQKMDWEWKMKELSLCEFKAKPVIDETHVPIVHVSDDFDLLPA